MKKQSSCCGSVYPDTLFNPTRKCESSLFIHLKTGTFLSTVKTTVIRAVRFLMKHEIIDIMLLTLGSLTILL